MELTADTVENWEEYDTVFIGYPIWWGIAAWPVNDFIQANDFTGKTVIPFATSSSSGMGESGELLAELAGTGDWQEGQRFRSGGVPTSIKASWGSGHPVIGFLGEYDALPGLSQALGTTQQAIEGAGPCDRGGGPAG